MSGALEGRVALVTGASSGIGEATAEALAAAGAAVALSARRAERLKALAERIEQAGGRALVLPGDVAEEAVATGIVESTLEHFGRLDILVNSAGIIRPGGVADGDLDAWRKVMDINFMASLYTSRAAIAPMKAQGSGDIVQISSTAGRRAAGMFGPYSASKFALNAMSDGMRQEVGKHGIRVCVVEPGATTTEVAESIPNDGLRAYMHDYVNKEGAMEAADVADMIVHVVSMPQRVNVCELLIRPTIDTTPT